MQNSTSVRRAGVRWILGLGAAYCALGCGAPAQASSAPQAAAAPAPRAKAEDTPFDLDAMMKREATGLGPRTVKGSGWTAEVPGLGQPAVELVDDVEVLDIPIAEDSNVRCQVYAEAADAAATLHSIIRESSDRVEYRTVAPVPLRILAGMPVAGIRAFYVTDVEGGKAAGHLQAAIRTAPDRSLLCLLDDVGYVATFEQVSASFFSSFTPDRLPADPATYTDVTKFSLDSTDVGFSLTRLVPEGKPGERTLTTVGARFLPKSDRELTFTDEYTVLRYDPKGQLASGTWVEVEGGDVTVQMSLERGSDGKYSYSGKVGGKEHQGSLSAPNGLVTTLQLAALLKKKLASGAPFSETVLEYHPSLEPAAALPVAYNHEKGAPARQVTAQLGDIKITTQVDSDGMPESGWADRGKNKLVLARERVEGHP